ncbi:cytochrome P450 [Kutzneria sp. NPDC052558]|uniref:cytochrome P450 n=1 Tax=Kutzneria sp. NPDC052558 TaxID=3364121 RepID=UPI0037C9FC75
MSEPTAHGPNVAADDGLPPFPMARTCPFDPPAAYAGLRETGRLNRVQLYDGETAWVANRYEDIKALFNDPRLSSDRAADGYPKFSPRAEVTHKQVRLFMFMDDPEHREHRKALLPRFTVRQIDQMRPFITETVDGFLDAMLAAGPPADLVTDLALPVACSTIGHLLGVPYADFELFRDRFTRLITATSGEDAGLVTLEAMTFLHKLIQDKADDPGDDLLSTLVVEQLKTERMSHMDLLYIAALMMFAGHETTANMISLGALTLLEHPEQLAALRDGSVPTTAVVEELLRYLSIVDTVPRVATEDVAVGEHTVRAGEGLVLPLAAANRDPEHFPEPDTFDVRRQARHHLSFGHGIHQCLGQNLARVELEITLDHLFRRVPGLRLAKPVAELPLKSAIEVQGISALPVTW